MRALDLMKGMLRPGRATHWLGAIGAIGAIDQRIHGLVAALNVKGLCAARASSEGRGSWRMSARPYAMFDAPPGLPAALASRLAADAASPSRRLHHVWTVTGSFCDGQLYFLLTLGENPNGLWWLVRRRLSADFAVLQQMANEVFQLRGRDPSAVQRHRQQDQRDGGAHCSEEDRPFASSRMAERIIRTAVSTGSLCRAKRSAAVDARRRRHRKLLLNGSTCFWRSYLGVPLVAAWALLVAMHQDSAFASPAPLPFDELAARCAPDIHPTTLKGVVSTESSWNPYAIGVVGGSLQRQPRSLDEAVAAARDLESKGFNFSMGLGQVNRYNLEKYGHTYETIFEPCGNLKAGAAILKDCYVRARNQMADDQQALRAAFSCYYSGNFTRGFRPDSAGQPSYVQKVVANAIDLAQASPVVPAVKAQSSDSAIPLRTSPRTSRSSRPIPKGPTAGAQGTQWVIYADAPGPSSGSTDRSTSPDAAPVKVQLLTPAAANVEPASSAKRPQAPVQVSEPTNDPVLADQQTPFVQFVN